MVRIQRLEKEASRRFWALSAFSGQECPLHKNLSAFHCLQIYRDLLDDFDSKSFQRGYFLWSIRQQADAVQIQVGENLGADANFALRLPFVFQQGREFTAAVEAEGGAVAEFLDRESLRSLVQVDQGARLLAQYGEESLRV